MVYSYKKHVHKQPINETQHLNKSSSCITTFIVLEKKTTFLVNDFKGCEILTQKSFNTNYSVLSFPPG